MRGNANVIITIFVFHLYYNCSLLTSFLCEENALSVSKDPCSGLRRAFKSAHFTCHITQRACPRLPSLILNGRLHMCATTPCDSTATVGLTFMVLCEMFGHGWVPSRVGACRLFVIKTVWDLLTFTYINLHNR